jgi:AICAR transformylase/IMP cyclohydrolase PurH
MHSRTDSVNLAAGRGKHKVNLSSDLHTDAYFPFFLGINTQNG